MKTRTKIRLLTAAMYVSMTVLAASATLVAYGGIYFAHHDSAYAEACPEQQTLLWCR